MSTFTLTYPIKTETSGTNQKHLILSDVTPQGAQVNPAVEYVENYELLGGSPIKKSISRGNVEIHNDVIYYPKIHTSTLTLIVNNYFDNSSEDSTLHKYINPYTEYYIINQDEYTCRQLNMSDNNDNWQEVTIDLRSDEVQTQIGSSSQSYYIMVAAVRDPNKFGQQIRLQGENSNGDIFTDIVGSNNSYYNFKSDDGKYVDVMHIRLRTYHNHYYTYYSNQNKSNYINVMSATTEEEMK